MTIVGVLGVDVVVVVIDDGCEMDGNGIGIGLIRTT